MELITTKVCMTKDIGVHGNLFGGIMLSWLDEAGAAFACEQAHSTKMVTRSMSEVEFCRPVKVGHIVKIYGELIHINKTSIRFKLEAKMFNPHTGREKIVTSTEMVFVRIDDDGYAIPIREEVTKSPS